MVIWYKLKEDKTIEPLKEGEYPDENDVKNRFLKKIHLNGMVISTVFMGMNLNFMNEGEEDPFCFETMVFDGEIGEKDLHQVRYKTYDEAIAGHEAIVKAYSTGQAFDYYLDTENVIIEY